MCSFSWPVFNIIITIISCCNLPKYIYPSVPHWKTVPNFGGETWAHFIGEGSNSSIRDTSIPGYTAEFTVYPYECTVCNVTSYTCIDKINMITPTLCQSCNNLHGQEHKFLVWCSSIWNAIYTDTTYIIMPWSQVGKNVPHKGCLNWTQTFLAWVESNY